MAVAVAPVAVVAVANLVAAVRNAVGNPDNEQGDYALCRPVGELHGSAITRPVVIVIISVPASVCPSACLSLRQSICLSPSAVQGNTKKTRAQELRVATGSVASSKWQVAATRRENASG